MFQGAVALNLDAKGRLAIPARHRDLRFEFLWIRFHRISNQSSNYSILR